MAAAPSCIHSAAHPLHSTSMGIIVQVPPTSHYAELSLPRCSNLEASASIWPLHPCA